MTMKRLVIAEKPSVGMSIAAVLGVKERGDGYLEGPEYIVSWCFGHLAELVNAEVYDERYAKWKREDLPIVPANWRFKVSRDKYKQFETVKTLMRREDVGEVVNACDAGREGELIFRTVYHLAGCSKPIKRLWVSSMEDEAIRQGFTELRDGREFGGLYQSALCRAKADWLVGINATRLFSVLYHRTLNVGRVVSPTLALIVQRDAEISAFQPETFHTVQLDFGDFTAESERFRDKGEAKALAAACSDSVAVMESMERKEKTEKAPALYDLTALQRDANKLLGYTAQQTLDYAQSLYEKKLCTYPRTDSRYLTDDMERGVNAIVLCAAGICDTPAPVSVLASQVCSSQKVSDHHAILPTLAAGEADLAALPAGEREVLKLIAGQVLRAVGKPHRYAEPVLSLRCGGAVFQSRGKTVLDMGWKGILQKKEQDSAPVPVLAEGQELRPGAVTVKDGKTAPPKAYTESSLLAAMETAGVKDMPEDAERKGLGTPATRAGIIEKLVSTGFVERKKVKKAVTLVPANTGVSLITVLPEQLQSPLLTAEWEHKLKMVERGELTPEEFMCAISLMVNELVKTYTPIKGADVLFPSGREVIGKCPRCGGNVTESKKGYFCEKNDCRFGLWRDNKFLTGKKITLTTKMASALLVDGRAAVKNIFSERTGKSYDADLVLTDDGAKSLYHLDFGKESGQ